MITVERNRILPANPETVFAVLANPDDLALILPRVQRIEVLERSADHAKVRTHVVIGPFGDVRSEGEVRWKTNAEVIFSAQRPVALAARWTLVPVHNGTDLRVALDLDLRPLIGPLASFVPPAEVAKVVAPDLDAALAAIARRVGQHSTAG